MVVSGEHCTLGKIWLDRAYARCSARSGHQYPSIPRLGLCDGRRSAVGLLPCCGPARRHVPYMVLRVVSNMGRRLGLAQSSMSIGYPVGHSTTPPDLILPTSQHGPQRSVSEFGTKGYMADQRFGPTVGLNAWAHAARDAVCAPAISPCFRRRLGPAMYPVLCGNAHISVSLRKWATAICT